MPILDFFAFLLNLINSVIVPFIFTIAFLVFIWGIVQGFILNSNSDDKRKEARKFAIYGIIGFFLMISVWGMVNVLVGTFGFQGQGRPPLPSFGAPSGGNLVEDILGDIFGGGNGGGGGDIRTRRGRVGESCRPPLPGCEYGVPCNTATYICGG